MTITRPTVLALAVVAAFASGCETEMDEARAANLTASDAEAAELLDVALELEAETKDSEAFEREPTLADEVLDELARLAEQEPCEIRGSMVGFYRDGDMRLGGGNDEYGVVGGIRGFIDEDQNGDPESLDWSGSYYSFAGVAGSVTGKLRLRRDKPPEMVEDTAPIPPPYVPELAPYGTFTSTLSASPNGSSEGHVFGLWVPNPDNANRGVLIGHYAVCEVEI